jgi:selenide,water dikinase
LAIVGGGAGGVELALNMRERFSRDLKTAGREPSVVSIVVLTRGDRVLANHTPATSVELARILNERHIDVLYGHEVASVEGNELVCSSGARVEFDECVWCTQAGAAQWLRDTGLELDAGGFIKVRIVVWVPPRLAFDSLFVVLLPRGHPWPVSRR